MKDKPYTKQEVTDFLNLRRHMDRDVNFSDMCKYYLQLLDKVAKLEEGIKEAGELLTDFHEEITEAAITVGLDT